MAKQSQLELELEAMQVISSALEDLEAPARRRVLEYILRAEGAVFRADIEPARAARPRRLPGARIELPALDQPAGDRLVQLLADGPLGVDALSKALGLSRYQTRGLIAAAKGVRRVGSGKKTEYALANGGAR